MLRQNTNHIMTRESKNKWNKQHRYICGQGMSCCLDPSPIPCRACTSRPGNELEWSVRRKGVRRDFEI